MRAALLLLLLLLLVPPAGCGDQVAGNLLLRPVAPHLGRNPWQDPFALVESLELAVFDELGRRSVVGEFAPGPRSGPCLATPPDGAPQLVGRNQLGRPLASGFAAPVEFRSGLQALLPVNFSTIDYAVATRLADSQALLPDPFAGQAPSLWLDASFVQSGTVQGDGDLSALAWVLWQPDRLWVRLRVRDEHLAPAAQGEDPATGDAVRFYLPEGTLTVGAAGNYENQGLALVSEPQAITVTGGYQVDWQLHPPVSAKNDTLPADLRVYDRDGDDGTPARVTWRFDPRAGGDDPAPEEFGALIWAAPLWLLVQSRTTAVHFSGSDGEVEVSGDWNQQRLRLQVRVPDDEVVVAGDLEQVDHVVLRLDLANGLPPVAEPLRFVQLAVSAGSDQARAGGQEPGQLTADAWVFTGQASGTLLPEGYQVDIELPWEDLGLGPEQPQRGWLLGCDVVVHDHDSGATTTTSLSSGAGDGAELWPEILLDRIMP